jgi:DNA-binding transcriptional MocR family regulator
MNRTSKRQHRITGATSAAIAASLEGQIREGHLQPGAALPTVRSLANELGVSTATVADAYRALRLRGIVRTHGRRGTTVADRPPLSRAWAPTLPAPGLHNLVDGNPDPRLLPPLSRMLAKAGGHALYGDPRKLPELVEVVLKHLQKDGIPVPDVAVVGGATDGIARVLEAHLAPGDAVGVEDPTFPPLFDLLGALGLVPVPIQLDHRGPLPDSLQAVVRRGVEAIVVTSRAQNPTGAAIEAVRSRELRRVLRSHPDLLVIEDDTGGAATDDPLHSVVDTSRSRWAFVRSFSMIFGPDLRTAVVAADEVTLSRVEGRQWVGSMWVSHILQRLTWMLLTDRATSERVRQARRAYATRRAALVDALARHGIDSPSRSGFHVWIPVAQEASTIAALHATGWVVAAGEPFRLESPPGIRVTASRMAPLEAEAFARDLATASRARITTSSG